MHVRANPSALNSSKVRGLGFSDCGREWVHPQLLENFVSNCTMIYLSIIPVDKLGGICKYLMSTTRSTMVSEVNLKLFKRSLQGPQKLTNPCCIEFWMFI